MKRRTLITALSAATAGGTVLLRSIVARAEGGSATELLPWLEPAIAEQDLQDLAEQPEVVAIGELATAELQAEPTAWATFEAAAIGAADALASGASLEDVLPPIAEASAPVDAAVLLLDDLLGEQPEHQLRIPGWKILLVIFIILIVIVRGGDA